MLQRAGHVRAPDGGDGGGPVRCLVSLPLSACHIIHSIDVRPSTLAHTLYQTLMQSVGNGLMDLIHSGFPSHSPTTLTRWPGRGCEPGNRLYPHKASGAAEAVG